MAIDFAKDLLPSYLIAGGQRLSSSSGGVFDHVNPATGKVQQSLPLAGPAEIDAAVAAAREAFPAWRRWAPTERRRVLFRLAELIREQGEDLATVVSLEIGLPISQAPRLAGTAVRWLEEAAGWTDKLYGDVVPFGAGEEFAYTALEPVGVVGVIATWNGSSGAFGMAAGPALAAGCCVVMKPSELAPFGMIRIGELALEAGVPPGVVNILPGGPEAGDRLVRHPDVDKVAFTGSPATGKRIAAACAESLRPCLMELGGKSPVIVFDDADLDAAAGRAMSVTFNAGQVCTFGSRLLVHSSVYDQMVERIAANLDTVKQGDPFDPETTMGPVINRSSCDRIMGMIEQAKAAGAGVVAGGRRRDGALAEGFFIEPTVLAVDNDAEIARTEVFGPVVSVIRFDDDEEAVALANDTEYGLAAYAFTRDVTKAIWVADRLDAGSVGINGGTSPGQPNMPFGGRKQSGYGKQGGQAGVMEFVHTKSVQVKLV
ncbi:MAG TPA: aldehyde dehydrogenase family protein [Acidimicrobiales bacterium]|nr:aldehyde dehydrogenase family protein [Acidimicrobiales bacterium]